MRAQPYRMLDANRAWLAALLFLPWALLTVTGGGIHNHALALTGRPAASDSPIPGGAPRLHEESAASPDAPCTACLWQLYSSATLLAPPDEPAALPAGACLLACQIFPRAADAWSFDPRAPPLS